MLYHGAKTATASGSDICGGTVRGSNDVKSLLFIRDGTSACNNSENTENTDNMDIIDATNHDKQTLQVSKPVADPDNMSIMAASHVIMMTVKGNENGVGSYTCMIDSTGTGAGIWTEMEVKSDSADKISPDRVADVKIQAVIDPNQTCTGRLDDRENVCMVKCNDAATPGTIEKSVLVQLLDMDNTPTPTDPNSDIQPRASAVIHH